MPEVDSTAQAQLDTRAFAPAYFIWVDVVGDPIRITTLGSDVTFAGSGDNELDGTFLSFDHRVIDVSEVAHSESGSDTVTVTLSAIANIVDSGLLAAIADTTNWRGRTVRLWMQVYDPAGTVPQGAVVPYYTGYASAASIKPAADSQTVQLQVENYLAAFNQASNRDYLNQQDYDPDDNSAAGTLAAANMGRFAGGAATSTTGPGPSAADRTGWSGGGWARYNYVKDPIDL